MNLYFYWYNLYIMWETLTHVQYTYILQVPIDG